MSEAAKPTTFVPARLRAWLIVGLTIALVFAIRLRLRDMPLERDEGEYAYAGQLLLQGVAPYKEAYNMKLPGTYAAYAIIMLLFGQSPAGIHFGLALVNAASIVLVFLIGRRLLDPAAGVAAAIAFAFMSLSTSVIGLAAHATHFVALTALAGLFLLITACERRTARRLFASGLLFGLCFLMKQHGALFALFAGLYVLWTGISSQIREHASTQQASAGRRRRPRPPGLAAALQTVAWPRVANQCAVFAGGVVLPYGLTCLVLWAAGAFDQFIFWTISYAAKYVSAIPADKGLDVLRAAFQIGAGPGLLFWILPGVAAIVMWWEERLPADFRFLLIALALCSFGSVSLGFYFREHYFILLLPALALLAGVAVSRAVHLLKHDKTIELFLALPILALFVIASGAVVVRDGPLFFTMSPGEASRHVYATTLFSEAINIGKYLKSTTPAAERIAVMGSEPEIYFYTRRRAATGFIYTYPLLETHDYAPKMQEQMIAEIERAQPDFFVYVNDPASWFERRESHVRLFEWWREYWVRELELVRVIRLESGNPDDVIDNGTPVSHVTAGTNNVLIFQRKNAHSSK